MREEEWEALDDLRAEAAEEVAYMGAGLDGDVVAAIWTQNEAPDFQGPGRTLRRSTFMIAIAELPEEPRKDDRIVRGSVTYKVTNRTRRDDLGEWHLVCEIVG